MGPPPLVHKSLMCQSPGSWTLYSRFFQPILFQIHLSLGGRDFDVVCVWQLHLAKFTGERWLYSLVKPLYSGANSNYLENAEPFTLNAGSENYPSCWPRRVSLALQLQAHIQGIWFGNVRLWLHLLRARALKCELDSGPWSVFAEIRQTAHQWVCADECCTFGWRSRHPQQRH